VIAAVWALLGIGAAAAWLAAIAFVRLETPLERLHAVTFLNLVAGGAIMLAAFASDGASARAFKCLAIWLVTILAGALLSFRVARALHLRSGEMR